MPEYRIRASGEVVSDLARTFPNVSLPQVLTTEDLDVLGVDPILEGAQPDITPYQHLIRSGPEQINGLWFWSYTVADFDADVVAAVKARQWDAVRADRNARLSATDWTMLQDVPCSPEEKTAWATYRQALRDVTNQDDPFAITWPTAP